MKRLKESQRVGKQMAKKFLTGPSAHTVQQPDPKCGPFRGLTAQNLIQIQLTANFGRHPGCGHCMMSVGV